MPIPLASSAADGLPRAESRPLRVLLIEDDADHVLVARHLLKAAYGVAGFSLDRAADAGEARAQLQRGAHDVVLLDYRLGETTGLDLLREAAAGGCRTPIILLTGQGDRDTDVAAMQGGAADYLIKGEFGSQALERAIRYAIERRRAQDALRHAHEELETRVTERTAELARAKEEAERASRAKSQFLSRMSHELRTPLNAILGFAQLLEMDPLSDEQRDGLGHILTGSRRLLTLINEVLDITHFQTDAVDLEESIVPLGEALALACEGQEAHARERGVRIEPVAGSCAGAVMADRRRLVQAFGHLISNAIKFNQPGGSVAITCGKVGGDRVRVTVQDSGPGIAPEDLPKLFTPFERLKAEAEGIDGAGLGLAVTKWLVEAMGGTVSVESAVGAGSAFSVELLRAGGS